MLVPMATNDVQYTLPQKGVISLTIAPRENLFKHYFFSIKMFLTNWSKWSNIPLLHQLHQKVSMGFSMKFTWFVYDNLIITLF